MKLHLHLPNCTNCHICINSSTPELIKKLFSSLRERNLTVVCLWDDTKMIQNAKHSCGHPVWLLNLPKNMGWFKDHGINCNLCFGYWLMQQFITTVVILHDDFPFRYSLFKSSHWFFFYSHQRHPVLTCLQSQSTNIHHLSPQVVKSNIKKRNITSSQYYFPGRECKIKVTLSINLSYFVSSRVRAELSEPTHSTFIEEGTWMGFKALVNFLTFAGDLIACKYSYLAISTYC